ncbi:DUF3077 domain-containing protein [Pseudomonas sp. SAS7]|uniref:DUF3077 domain-containing protein n=1 Tax=Pseudomonas sp. SAS7 TaxID=3156487 RepID=UPI003F9868FF
MSHRPRKLWSTAANVPFSHAFSQLSVLLGCIRHLTTEAEMENDRIAGSAARILSEMAKALIDDMERGMSKVLQKPSSAGAALRP